MAMTDFLFLEYFLIANAYIAVPYIIDFLFEIFSDKTKKSRCGIRSYLILSLIIPNLLIFISLNYYNNIKCIVLIFNARFTFVIYGLSYNIWLNGESYFKSKLFITGNILLNCFIVILTCDIYAPVASTLFFWIAFGFFIIGSIILSNLFLRWILFIKLIRYENMQLSQKNCISYIMLFMFYIMFYFITLLIYGGNYNINYCVIITFIEGFTIISLIIIDNRASRSEMLFIKDVSACYINILIYIYILFIIFLTYLENIRNEKIFSTFCIT